MQATIKDVARLAGVSASTVSRALNKGRYVKEETLKKIWEACKELGYKPNTLARSLVNKKSNTIGLIIPEIANPFYSEIIAGVESVVTKKNYSMILVSGYSQTGEAEVETLLGRQVDGIIHGGVYTTNTAISKLKAKKYPIVLLGRKLPGIETDCVIINDRYSAYRMTKHLIATGHTRLAYIYGRDESTGSTEKFAGFRKALEEAGIEFSSDYLEKGSLSFEGGYAAGKRLLMREIRPTAIIAGNDIMALGARQAIYDVGLTIPEDIALVGFDDIFISSISGIDLTTVAVPRFKMGSLGAELLINKIENPESSEIKQIILEPELMIRKTCGCKVK